MTKNFFAFLVTLLLTLGAGAGCQDSFEQRGSTGQILVTLEGGDSPGGPGARLPLSFIATQKFTVKIVAQKADGTIDTAFNGFVRATMKPGTVVSVTAAAPVVTNGRNVQLSRGVADGVIIEVVGAYGNSRIWIEDIGFVPADPAGTPQCANGIDDNHNGMTDYPADPGCAFANDDTEDGGTYATGASEALYYVYPRIADVRGVSQGGSGTPFPHEQVQIDTQWNGTTAATTAGIVVTRVASDGFYATDLGDPRGYSSVFSYTYTAPPRMRVCDRLVSFGGTASDFFGFTEIGFPTWIIEEWVPIDPNHPDPAQRLCLVPEPSEFSATPWAANQAYSVGSIVFPRTGSSSLYFQSTTTGTTAASEPTWPTTAGATVTDNTVVWLATQNVGSTILKVGDLANTQLLLDKESSLVRVVRKGTVTIHVGAHFGPDFPSLADLKPTDNATNCDFNRDGKIEFTVDPEKTCAANCTADPECSEFSQYLLRSGFRIVVVDTAATPPSQATIAANASTSPTFDPVLNRGKDIGAFTGTFRYFSGGGGQFTIESRCDADIVADPAGQPLPSDKACVSPRVIADTNGF